MYIAWKLSKKYTFPCILNEYGKYGPEKNPYLDTFHAVVYRRKRNNEAVLSG